MGILDRLGNVLRSYVSFDDERVFNKGSSRPGRDPDLDEAFEELDDFLKGNDGKWKSKADDNEKTARRPITEDIKKAFAELGLTPDAAAEECKEAYKKLIKIHHPDRHANHPGNMKKATEKTARVNDAYERLMEWFRGS